MLYATPEPVCIADPTSNSDQVIDAARCRVSKVLTYLQPVPVLANGTRLYHGDHGGPARAAYGSDSVRSAGQYLVYDRSERSSGGWMGATLDLLNSCRS
jgi:hypothetical protein